MLRWGGFSVLALLACTTFSTEARRAPVYQRVPGALMVGLTTPSADPRPQADAFAAFVQEATGEPTRAALFPDYDSLAAALAKGELDIAFLSPLAYVRAADAGKVEALLRAVRGGRDTYRAVLFTRADKRLAGLSALKRSSGLKVAWVDPSSAAGHIVPKALLVENGIDPAGLFVQQDFAGSHDAVCRAVADRRSDIGATFVDDPATSEVTGCRAALGDRVSELSIVVQSEEIPNDVLAVRPAFPEDLKGRLLVGATALTTNDAGKKTLGTAFSCDGFSQVKRDDYDAVRHAVEVFRP